MILIIFGSKSDEHIYLPLLKGLKEKNIEYELKIASAHKSPNYVNEILQNINDKYNLIIAGAGLAAHLPGVIAAKTIRPVIGIPINVNFEGLDALLSILQMPPYVPVLAVGVDCYNLAIKQSELILKKFSKVNIVNHTPISEKQLKKITDIFTKFNIIYDLSDEFASDCININPIELGNGIIIPEDQLSINIPFCENSNINNIKDVLTFSKYGIWVGLNRFENAALSCVQILNLEDKYSKKLLEFKEELENIYKKNAT